MKSHHLSFFLLLFSLSVFGQHGSLLISPAGGVGQLDRIALQWSLGEVAVQSFPSGGGWITEGFQQPQGLLRPVAMETGWVPSGTMDLAEYDISIFPNPVRSALTISIKGSQAEQEEAIFLYLFDGQGHLLSGKKEMQVPGQIEWDLSPYPAGLYLLRFDAGRGAPLKEYRLVKVH